MFGWQNSATYGSVISYNVYWIFVIAMFACMRFQEVRGHWPWSKGGKVVGGDDVEGGSSAGASEVGVGVDVKRTEAVEVQQPGSTLRE